MTDSKNATADNFAKVDCKANNNAPAIKQKETSRSELWLAANREALESSNAYVEKNGLPLSSFVIKNFLSKTSD
jgi:post-segregation antitoxin (ccd killing protein)